jgi:peptide chain release factor 1
MSYDSTLYLHQHLQSLQQQKAQLESVMAADPELAELAQDELTTVEAEIASTLSTIQAIENPVQAPRQFNNCIIELRPGAGGDEAKIWMNDLLAMYTRYAVLKNFKVELLDDAVIQVRGKGAFNTFQYESGVHRVQRVPETEAQGRLHTSTASVAVIPEIPAAQVEVNDDDLDWQFYRSGGKGGQNVNKVSTAVRLTHVPTGIVVTASQERRQEQNREIALQILRGKIWEIEEAKRIAEVGDARSAIGRAQRAEKIRTYNYPQNRLTDHRIPQSWYDLDRRLQGDLDDVIEALKQWELDPEVPPHMSQ